MHIAILMTNTDESAFAEAHPKDGEKFTALLQMARPDWRTTVYAVKDGEFPADISAYDGAMITGSPASTRSGEAWVAQLLDLIRQVHALKLPLFGCCFGHQAIALALGGSVDNLPSGWVHGRTENHLLARPDWARDLPDVVSIYGSHVEYVRDLPAGALPLMERAEVNTGFTLGDHIATTQHHPEMTHAFICALTEEMRAELGPEVYVRAMATLEEPADQPALAEAIARFFEAR